jgi:LAGLIDADG endonuclease
MGADNQQERLVRIGWVLGFVDGEGCFSLGLVRQSSRDGRVGYQAGYQVFHEFVVTQGARSVSCLHELREFFGVGMVLEGRRRDDHRDVLCRYVVRRRADLLQVIIPFFREHRLRSAKRDDFDKFAGCVESMQCGGHLTSEGLASIVEVVATMNRQKPRHELIRILRGHTPDTR